MLFLLLFVACVVVRAAPTMPPAVRTDCPSRPTSCSQHVAWNAASEQQLFEAVCLQGDTEPRAGRCEDVPAALGNFTCACCGNPLFRAADACHPGTGACVVPAGGCACSLMLALGRLAVVYAGRGHVRDARL